jgi:filamentous hemagglutinin
LPPAPGTLTAASAIRNDGGRVLAGGPITLQTPQLNNADGILSAASLTVAGPSFSNAGGSLNVSGAFSAEVGSFDNTRGRLQADSLNIATTGDLLNQDGTLRSESDATLSVGGNLLNSRGAVASVGALTANVGGAALNTSGGALGAGTDLSLRAGSLNNVGSISAGNDATLAVASALVNDGAIAAGRHASLVAGSMQSGGAGVLGAGIRSDGGLAAEGQLNVATTHALAAHGTHLAAGHASFRGASVDVSGSNTRAASIAMSAAHGNVATRGATVTAGGALTIDAADAIDNAAGLIRSAAAATLNAARIDNGATQGLDRGIEGRDIAVSTRALNNTAGAIRASQNVTITSAGSLDNTGGWISAGDTLRIVGPNAAVPAAKTLAITNTAGSLIADKRLQLDATAFSGDGKLASAGELSVALTRDVTNNAEVSANGNLSYTSAGTLNNNGKLLAGGVLAVGGNTLTNAAGAEMTGDTTVVNAGTLTNRGLIDGRATQVNAGTVNNIGTGRLYGDIVSIGAGTLNNDAEAVNSTTSAGTIAARSTLDIGAGNRPGKAPEAPLVVAPQAVSSTIAVGNYTYLDHVAATGAPRIVPVGERAGATGGVAAGRPSAIVEVPALAGTAMVVRTSTPGAGVPTASLFRTHPEPSSRYLIETDSRFAGYRNWLDSDYLLDALGLDPGRILKRLGDSFYEQRLIREQVAQLTGSRYLAGFASDEEQYAALMNAGVTFAQEYQLTPGVALTAAQMAQLTSDIVWLVEQEEMLTDGTTQRVLVPQVYVRVRPGDIDGSGALLSAEALRIRSEGDLRNTGTLAGRRLVAINADTIDNLGGHISGGSVALQARSDLNNLGGSIEARNALDIQAGRDINVLSTTRSDAGPGTANTHIDRIAGLYVTGPGGTLVASAGRDLHLAGAVVRNAGRGQTSLSAGYDITLGTVTTSKSDTAISSAATLATTSKIEVGSMVAGGGDFSLDAGRDVTARAATVSAGDKLSVHAGRDLTIESGRSHSAAAYSADWSDKGVLRHSANSFSAQTRTDSAIASKLQGANVNLDGGRDVHVVGSDITAAGELQVAAGRNLNIVSAAESSDAAAQSSRSTSGVLAPRGLRVDAARSQQQQASVGTLSERASNLSAGGNATLAASDQVNVYASNVSAGQALDITGREVNVYSGVNQREASYGAQSARTSLGATGSMGRSGTNGRSRTGETNRLEQTTLAPATLTGNQVHVTATGGDVTLAGARISANQGTTLNAAQGAINLGVVVTGAEATQQRGGKDLLYQRASDAGVRTESANYTRIDSPNVAVNAPRVNVQIGQNVQQSASAGPGVTSQTLSQAIASQAGQPGLQWLSQVQNDAQLNNLQVNWQGVPLAQRQWAERQSGLTQTGAAVVSIVATVLTWGAAGGAGLAVEGAVGSGAWGAAAGAAVQAGIANIAGQASVSLINNSGDIGAVLNDLGSRQGVRSLLTSMATAGAVQGLNTSLGIEGWTTANGASPMQVLGRNVLDGAAAAVIRTAANGGSLQDNLAEGLANGLLNTAASESAGWIGANGPNGAGSLNAFTAEVAHAIAGCAVGAGRAIGGGYDSGSGCSAGAIGSMVGHLAGNAYNPTNDPAYAEQTIAFAQLMAGIAGALAGGNQAGADIAAVAGANAVENNQMGRRNAGPRQPGWGYVYPADVDHPFGPTTEFKERFFGSAEERQVWFRTQEIAAGTAEVREWLRFDDAKAQLPRHGGPLYEIFDLGFDNAGALRIAYSPKFPNVFYVSLDHYEPTSAQPQRWTRFEAGPPRN